MINAIVDFKDNGHLKKPRIRATVRGSQMVSAVDGKNRTDAIKKLVRSFPDGAVILGIHEDFGVITFPATVSNQELEMEAQALSGAAWIDSYILEEEEIILTCKMYRCKKEAAEIYPDLDFERILRLVRPSFGTNEDAKAQANDAAYGMCLLICSMAPYKIRQLGQEIDRLNNVIASHVPEYGKGGSQ